MKDEDFFQKEFAKEMKQKQKDRDAYMKEAAIRKKEEQEEVKSLNDRLEQKPIEVQQITRTYTKQVKPINRLNKTELMNRFVDGDIPLQTYCDMMDKKQSKFKRKPSQMNMSSATMKPVRNFFKPSKTREALRSSLVEIVGPKVHEDTQFLTLNDLLADLDLDERNEPQPKDEKPKLKQTQLIVGKLEAQEPDELPVIAKDEVEPLHIDSKMILEVP